MSRTRFFAVAGLAVLLGGSSFAAASYALGAASGDPPQLRPNLPAATLPTISLDDATSVRLNNSIGAPGVAHFGITPASYTAVRRLADTSIGTFYLVPGTRGVCIVTESSGAACGDPGAAGQPMLALWTLSADKDALVGEGIAAATTESVPLQIGSGSVTEPVSLGQFRIREPVVFDSKTATVSLVKN